MDTINNKQMDFVREYLLNVCNFNDNICDNLVERFSKMNKNVYNSIFLNDNEKYQVLFEVMNDGININSKVTMEYFYDGEEWVKEEYVNERQDRFIVEEFMLHHLYDKKKTAIFSQEHGATREGIIKTTNEDFYLLTDDFSFSNVKLSTLQKVKK